MIRLVNGVSSDKSSRLAHAIAVFQGGIGKIKLADIIAACKNKMQGAWNVLIHFQQRRRHEKFRNFFICDKPGESVHILDYFIR